MDTATILAELNLDENDNNTTLVTNLIAQAQDIILHSIDSTKTVSDFSSNLIFNRAVITLVTQLYYDRTLSEGLSLGLRMMINQLKGQVTVSDSN